MRFQLEPLGGPERDLAAQFAVVHVESLAQIVQQEREVQDLLVTDFAADLYRSEFGRVLNLAATYPGAVIVIEGHSDPLKYLQDRQQGVAPANLDQTKQAAKNLSVQRAIAVRESLVSLGRASQLALDNSQFTVVGAGIDRPKYANPSTEQEWRANMRVDFQITQVEAELEQFSK